MKIIIVQLCILMLIVTAFKIQIVQAQNCEPIQVSSVGDNYIFTVDRDSAHVNLHKKRYSVEAACVFISTAGFYKLYTSVEYSIDQWNESFYLSFQKLDRTFSPQLEPNVGNYRVVQDTSGQPSMTRRYAGKFYLEPGYYIIILSHYYLIHLEFPEFLNLPNEHLDDGNPESVHLFNFEFEYWGNPSPFCDLTISKTADKDTVKIDEIFDFNVTIGNLGPACARKITVVDTMPANISTLNFTPQPHSITGNVLFWHFDSLISGQKVLITFSAFATNDLPEVYNSICNQVTIQAAGDTNLLNNYAAAVVIAAKNQQQTKINYDISLAKTANLDTVAAGKTFQYEIAVKNFSPQTAFNIMLCDTLPTYIEATDFSSSPDSSNERIIFWFIDSLAAGQNFSTLIEAQVAEIIPYSRFSITNSAFISADFDTNAANNFAQVKTTLIKNIIEQSLNYDLSLRKTTAKDTLLNGERCNYNLQIKNNGPANAYALTLIDTLPNFIAAENFTLTPDSIFENILFWRFDSLGVGEEKNIYISAATNADFRDTIFTIINSARLFAEKDTNQINNYDRAENTIVSKNAKPADSFDLAISKTASTDTVAFNGLFAYYLNVRNFGPQNAYAVTLVDTMPDLISANSYSLNPDSISQNLLFWHFDSLTNGEEKSILIECRLSENAPDTGVAIVNSAYVSAQQDTNLLNNYAWVKIIKLAKKEQRQLNCDLTISEIANVDTIFAGQSFQFQLTIENFGPGSTQFTLTDSMPDLIEATNFSQHPDSAFDNLLFWFFDSLNAGSKIDLNIEVKTEAIVPASLSAITNTARVDAAFDTNGTNDIAQARVIVLRQQNQRDSTFDLSLSKTASKDTVTVGEKFDYTIIVKNLSLATAYNIALTDTMPDFIRVTTFSQVPDSAFDNLLFWFFDSINAGSKIHINLEVKTDAIVPASLTAITNTVRVDAAADTNSLNNIGQAGVIVLRHQNQQDTTFDFSVKKTASKDTVTVGDKFDYTIVVKNLGPTTAYNIALIDTLPDIIIVSSFHPQPDSALGNIIFWHVDSLKLNEEFIVTLAATAPAEIPVSIYSLTNVVSASAPFDSMIYGKRAKSKVVVVEKPKPPLRHFELRLSKTASQDTVMLGDEFSYEIKIENLGPDIAYFISLTDSLPALISVLKAEPEPDSIKADIYFWFFDSLQANKEIIVTLLAKTNQSNPDSLTQIDNVAMVSAPKDNSSVGKKATARVIVVEPVIPTDDFQLGLTKTADKDTVKAGEFFNYELHIKNFGPATAFNITLIDTLPTTISVTGFEPDPASVNQNIVLWKFDSLAANEEKVVTISAKVKPELADSIFAVDNVAVVTAPNDTSINGKKAKRRIIVVDEDKQLKANYNLGLTKSADKDTVSVGENFEYTLTIKNNGPHIAYNVLLTDTMPDLITASNFHPEPDSIRGNLFYWNFKSISVGQKVTVFFTALIESLLPETFTSIKNVTAIAAANDTSASDDEAEAEIIAFEVGSGNCETDYYFNENCFVPDNGHQLDIYFKLNYFQIVTLDLYDISGYHLTTLVEDEFNRGLNKYQWDGQIENKQHVGSGVYIIALRSKEMTCWKKVIVVR